jgi:hypothetical protein
MKTSAEDVKKEAEAERRIVRAAMEELRSEFRFFKEPTVNDVACRAGKHPEIVKSILYALAPETRWKEPQEHAEREAKDAINLAGWLRWKQKGERNSQLEALSTEAINNASKDTERRAQDTRELPRFSP